MVSDPFSGILDPFAYWDIAATYTRYFSFFDLVIYSTIFIAICHAVFANRFSGRAGKAMATAFGIGLGIALTLAEVQFGWNLTAAGPYALIIILLLLGFLLFHVQMAVHIPWQIALPLTYVLMYALLRALSPALFRTLADKLPFINLLTALIFLFAVWQLGVEIWHRFESVTARHSSGTGFISGLNRANEKRALKVEKRIKGNLAPKAERMTKKLAHNLEAVRAELWRSNPDWNSINEALNRIAHESDDVIETVDQIRILDRRLRNFDWQELKELNGYFPDLSPEEQSRLKERIQNQRAKIVQEHALNDLTERIESRFRDFRRAIDELSRSCHFNDRDQALDRIAVTIQIERGQKDDLTQLNRLQTQLHRLTKITMKGSG